MWACTLLSHLIGIACLEGTTLQTVGIHCEYSSKYCHGPRGGWRFYPTNQSPDNGRKKQQCKASEWVYKAVGCMSEHFISQDSLKSAQCSSRALAWPNTFCSIYLYLLFPSLHVLVDPVVFGQTLKTEKAPQIFLQNNVLQQQGVEQQTVENSECRMQTRQILLKVWPGRRFSCVFWEDWQIQWCSSAAFPLPLRPNTVNPPFHWFWQPSAIVMSWEPIPQHQVDVKNFENSFSYSTVGTWPGLKTNGVQ